MYNWSTDIKSIKKDSRRYSAWKLEQLINFGLNGEKIREKELRKYWTKIMLDPHRRKFLKLLLHEKKDSH